MPHRIISKEVFDQFNIVRDTGTYNMLDQDGIKQLARSMGCDELAELMKVDYIYLLHNYDELDEHYNKEVEYD